MTVQVATTPQTFSANGVTTAFPFTFHCIDEDDLLVTTIESDGTRTEIDPDDYTVVLSSGGGTVTFDSAPTNGLTVEIASDRPYSQSADIGDNEQIRLDQIEEAIDSTVVLIQQLRAAVEGVEVDAGIQETTEIHATAPLKIDGAHTAELGDEPTLTLDPADIKLDDLGAPDDNTDRDASVSKHGLLPKLSGNVAQSLRGDGTFAGEESAIQITFDGSGSALVVDSKQDLYCPFAFTILSATLLADQVGSAAIGIWKDTYANYPPTIADSIAASALPTLTAALKSTDATLTGWTKDVAAGTTLRFNVDSAATITRLTLVLHIRKA